MTAELNTEFGPAFQSPYGPILLSELFDADTDRGVLKWRARSVDRFSSKRAFGTWNTRFAGAEALTSECGRGYKHGHIFHRRALAHRVLFAVHNGHWPVNQVDHINGVRPDNRACNLRDVSNSENRKNMAIPKNNTSGIVGVCWSKRDKKWQARIEADGRCIHLGYFTDLESAAATRKAAELAYGFHANHGRGATAT